MSPQEIYDWLSKTFPSEQWTYYTVLFGALVAIATFYREVLKGVILQIYEWFSNVKNIFLQSQMIPEIKKRIELLEKNLTEELSRLQELEKGHTSIKTEIQKESTETKEKVEKNTNNFNEIALPKLEQLEANIKNINSELSINSGKSLKDIIVRVADGMNNIEKSTSSLDFQVKRIEARQWNIMINSSDIPMFESDTNGLCVRANKSYLELVGMAQDDVLGNGWVNIIYLDDRKLVQAEWEGAIEDKRTFDLKYKIQNNRTNKVFSVRCVAQPVSVEKEVVGYIGRFVNIQELVQDQKTNFWVLKTNA